MGPLEGFGSCVIKDISKLYKQYLFKSLQGTSVYNTQLTANAMNQYKNKVHVYKI
jgi:hypothetical protein